MLTEQLNAKIDSLMLSCDQESLIGLIQAMKKIAMESSRNGFLFSTAKLKYNLNNYKLAGLTPEKVLAGYEKIWTKFYSQNSEAYRDQWYDNQLRIFVWVLIVYSFVQKRPIQKMCFDDWLILSKIFNKKSLRLIQFEALLVSNHHKREKKWTKEEKEMLQSIMKPLAQNKKWKQIAQTLFFQSNRKFFRNPKQCREHWLNYLDPNKLKAPWSIIEDYALLKSISSVGKKWAYIAKILGNKRTQHMVKNRFNSLMKKYKKNSIDEQSTIRILVERFRSQIGNQVQLIEKDWNLSEPIVETLDEDVKNINLRKKEEKNGNQQEIQQLEKQDELEEIQEQMEIDLKEWNKDREMHLIEQEQNKISQLKLFDVLIDSPLPF